MTVPTAPAGADSWILATRKGAWPLRGDGSRGPDSWQVGDPWFFGMQTHHVVQDPREGSGGPGTLLAAVRTGHLGPTVYRSTDGGETWQEAEQPPRFKTAEEAAAAGFPDGDPRLEGRTVGHVFFLAPSNADEPGVWYAGTSGIGLFRSEDDGATWQEVTGFNDHPSLPEWTWNLNDEVGTPDGPKTHSVQVHPTDPNKLLVGLSGGGVFVSEDRGGSWRPMNGGMAIDFMPPKEDGSEYEFGHDPHDVVIHPADPDRWWQQNHCGIYRLDCADGEFGGRWTRPGDNMPDDIGDIGFVMTCDPRDPDACWVFPMDGTSVWPRVCVDGRPAVYRTTDGGESWQRLDDGLPPRAWYTVRRQAMGHDGGDPLGLCFGTNQGEAWVSADRGDSWYQAAAHLPLIWSVSPARLA